MRKCMVLLAAMAFVVAFTLPVYAAEWSFYGSARVGTWWEDKSEEIGATCDDDLDFNMYTHGNSRVGANVKADDLSGQFELGLGEGAGISTRIIWGEYDFGMLKLGIGQTYSPTNFFISNQVFAGDTNMLPTGGIYSGRNPMVRFRFGNLDIAFVKPDTPTIRRLLRRTLLNRHRQRYGRSVPQVGGSVSLPDGGCDPGTGCCVAKIRRRRQV
jgi:hypothetical protein